jgi:hypothetical protein
MKRWPCSFLVLLIGGGSLFFLVPIDGVMVVGMPPVFDRLNAYALCPEAKEYSYNYYGFGQPTTTSPSGGRGHYTELTCTYSDGSQKTFPNEEVGLKGIGTSFTAVGICDGLVVMLLMIAAAIIGGQLVKPKTSK